MVEIATDKVDSEVPSEKKGVLIEKCFEVNDAIEVGQTIAIIETDEIEISAETNTENNIQEENRQSTEDKNIPEKELAEEITESLEKSADIILKTDKVTTSNKGFYLL